jgi:predicted RNase H-like HicB family nuclease
LGAVGIRRESSRKLMLIVTALGHRGACSPVAGRSQQTMNYPVVIHKDRNSDYGVTVPDLPGCFSAGATVDEALEMAREAIELHLEGLIEAGGVVPSASTIEKLRSDSRYADGTWAIVRVDDSSPRG